MEYKIEKGVPMPKLRNKYPFRQMEVGDSVYIPNSHAAASKSSYAAYDFQKRTGRKFISRKEGDGIRIWRIA